jgi:hypothetical protein
MVTAEIDYCACSRCGHDIDAHGGAGCRERIAEDEWCDCPRFRLHPLPVPVEAK